MTEHHSPLAEQYRLRLRAVIFEGRDIGLSTETVRRITREEAEKLARGEREF